MGNTHIITILQDAFSSFNADKNRSADDQCCELGRKIATLCQNHANPVFPSAETKTAELGNWFGAIAWRGFPDTSHDELFYWGADLKPLSALSDKEFEFAEKLLTREKEKRALARNKAHFH